MFPTPSSYFHYLNLREKEVNSEKFWPQGPSQGSCVLCPKISKGGEVADNQRFHLGPQTLRVLASPSRVPSLPDGLPCQEARTDTDS